MRPNWKRDWACVELELRSEIRNEKVCCWGVQVCTCEECTQVTSCMCVCGLAFCHSSRCVFLFCTFLHTHTHTHDSFSWTRTLNCCFSFTCSSQFLLYFLFVPEASVDGWLVALTTANHMPLVIVNSRPPYCASSNISFFLSFTRHVCVYSSAFPSLPPSPLLQSSGPQKVPTPLSVPFNSCKKQKQMKTVVSHAQYLCHFPPGLNTAEHKLHSERSITVGLCPDVSSTPSSVQSHIQLTSVLYLS